MVQSCKNSKTFHRTNLFHQILPQPLNIFPQIRVYDNLKNKDIDWWTVLADMDDFKNLKRFSFIC